MIKPLLHRVVVLPDPVETKTASGIVLALNEKREQAAAEMGTVVSVGPTVFRDYGGSETDLSVGDRVAFAKYAGKRITDSDVEYLILNDDDIICLIKE